MKVIHLKTFWCLGLFIGKKKKTVTRLSTNIDECFPHKSSAGTFSHADTAISILQFCLKHVRKQRTQVKHPDLYGWMYIMILH